MSVLDERQRNSCTLHCICLPPLCFLIIFHVRGQALYPLSTPGQMGELTYRVQQSRSHAAFESTKPSELMWALSWSLGGHWQISASQKWISFAHMASCHWLDIGGNPRSIYPWPRHVANYLVKGGKKKKNTSAYSTLDGWISFRKWM